jgi:hypothetical protein
MKHICIKKANLESLSISFFLWCEVLRLMGVCSNHDVLNMKRLKCKASRPHILVQAPMLLVMTMDSTLFHTELITILAWLTDTCHPPFYFVPYL